MVMSVETVHPVLVQGGRESDNLAEMADLAYTVEHVAKKQGQQVR